jgi:choline dehydrogenase-like flavoprotein
MQGRQKFDAIVVGTGFASSFFLWSYLKRAKPNERILVLERGQLDTHTWQIQHELTSSIDYRNTYHNRTPDKDWQFNIAFGGGSNCWWANTPRFLPSDFELKTRYGVGTDWPITYDNLEPYYTEAEQIMAISGPDDDTLYRRSAPYPQPPHHFSDPDLVLKNAYPSSFFHIATARARVATANRPHCCATGSCYLCPADAKFTILNEMWDIYEDERVTLELGAFVQTVDMVGGIAGGVTYRNGEQTISVEASLVILGTNALFNPFILMRSGLNHPLLGKRLNEQVGLEVSIDLAGLENYQGSTSATGMGFMEYDGEHRASQAAFMCLTNSSVYNDGALRLERGKWRQRLILGLSFEDLPSEENYVTLSPSRSDQPETVYKGFSDYSQRALDALPRTLTRMLEPLPVERFRIGKPIPTMAHIQGTTVMGDDPELSVIDRHLVHHQVRNLLVLGSGSFPTCPPPMPSLTISALSLWAADHL